MALGVHGDPVGRRSGAEGQQPRHESVGPVGPATATATATAAAAGHAGPALAALGRTLGDGAKAQHVAGVSGRDRGAGGDDRAELAGILERAVVPVQVEAQRLVHFGTPAGEKPGGMPMAPG